MGEAVAGRFYVRRRTRPDGSFDFWCVVNSYTGRPASKTKLKSKAAAEARRAKLQADFDRRAVRRFLSWGEVIGSNRSLIAVIPARRPLTACLPYARDPPKSEAAVVFQHVCEMGLEGIVSAAWLARRSGRSTEFQESESACREAGGRGRMGYREMTDRDLAQAERLIAECKNRIASQREVIANAFQKGHETDVAVSLLRAFESNLQAFEKHRQLIRAWQNRAEQR